jgi:hypothetical protein
MLSDRRLRSLVIDGVLVGAAISYASNLVSVWLLSHEGLLFWIFGSLHLVMLPLLTLSLLLSGAPGSQYMKTEMESRKPIARFFVWCVVLYFGLGFAIPLLIALDMRVNEAWMYITMFGPMVLTGFAVWMLLLVDKRTNHALSRIDAPPPKGFVTTFVLVSWAYLLCIEATLMASAEGRGSLMGAGTIAAAIGGYLPARLGIALAFDSVGWEVVLAFLAFCHFLYRLA